MEFHGKKTKGVTQSVGKRDGMKPTHSGSNDWTVLDISSQVSSGNPSH